MDAESAASKLRDRLVALDCEFVGVGCLGHVNALARVSAVDGHGRVLLDTFVNPGTEDWPVTDWRTWVSGIGPADVEGAPTPDDVRPRVREILDGKILVGHGLHSDLEALQIQHPPSMIRDTLGFPPLQRISKRMYPSLKTLARIVLGLDAFQSGRHDSVEDATVTLKIYAKYAEEFEAWVAETGGQRQEKSTPHYSHPAAKYLVAPEPTRAPVSAPAPPKIAASGQLAV